MKSRQSLVARTTEAIIDYIKINKLTAESKLPNEHQLAQDLQVSRSTLREAVRSLVSRNILEVRQGSGTYVSQKRGISEDPLGFSLIEDTLKLTNDLFAIRYILETEVAKLAAINASEEDLIELEQVKEAIESSVSSGDDQHLDLDKRFHSIISRASGNVAMNHLIPVINQSINLYNDFYSSKKDVDEMLNSHEEIFQAIKNKDVLLSGKAMQVHIAKVQLALHKYMAD